MPRTTPSDLARARVVAARARYDQAVEDLGLADFERQDAALAAKEAKVRLQVVAEIYGVTAHRVSQMLMEARRRRRSLTDQPL